MHCTCPRRDLSAGRTVARSSGLDPGRRQPDCEEFTFDGKGKEAPVLTEGDLYKAMRHKFGIKKAIIVGDRGMLTSSQLEAAAADPQLADYGWISALRSGRINKLVQEHDLQPELFDQRDLAEITSKDLPGERLMVCRNPDLAHLPKCSHKTAH